MLERFNVRVYGLLIRAGNVLLVDEIVKGRHITKFPGGGLELGEGPEDCLVREFLEETGITVRITGHVYTTGFFQPSAFREEEQIISIYYRVAAVGYAPTETIPLPESPDPEDGILGFRWIPLDRLTRDDVSLPIDQYVVANRERLHADDEAHPRT